MEELTQVSERAKQRILMAAVISHTDRAGRRLSDRFMQLPPRSGYPRYYEVITTPVDIETISSKIETCLYADLNALERDVTQMCSNARLYNAENSSISLDSIKLQNLFRAEKSRMEHEQRTRELTEKVFAQELLREMILDYAIHGEKKDKAVSNIRSCRLVCKDWLRSTSRILLKSREPLFWFSITCSDEHIGKSLDSFVNAVDDPSSLYDRVPPFAIRAGNTEVLPKDHRQSFYNCLDRCAGGLVELYSFMAAERDVAFFQDDGLSFPKLRKFQVHMCFFMENSNWKYRHQFELIQSVLDRSQQLESFELKDASGCIYPTNFFVLPSSLTQLTFVPSLSENFKTLELNSLPTLKKLQLGVREPPFKDKLITSILDKVRKTLTHFSMGNHFLYEPTNVEKQVATFRLPQMEKLHQLEIYTEYLELEQNFSSLEQHVPVLSHLRLTSHTDSAFRKWTDRSCFRSVTSLKTSLISAQPNRDGENIQLNFDNSAMECMKRAFPNLRELNIKICDEDASVVVFIMKEIRNLQVLKIRAIYSTDQRRRGIPNPHFWDAVFLGISLESVAALNESPESWEHFHHQSTVSIRNLTDLHTLKLRCTRPGVYFTLSNALFQHAFFKMPNLTKLDFPRRHFSVPEEMIQTWRKQGRFIESNVNGPDESGDTSEED